MKPQILENHKDSINKSYFCYHIALLMRSVSSEIDVLLEKDTVFSMAIIFWYHEENTFKNSEHSEHSFAKYLSGLFFCKRILIVFVSDVLFLVLSPENSRIVVYWYQIFKHLLSYLMPAQLIQKKSHFIILCNVSGLAEMSCVEIDN